MAHLLSRSHHAPSRAGPPPGVEAGRCERPAPSRMTTDLQFVHYVPRSKATMSEAELHILRARMYQGRLHKARRGAVYYHPPIGYVRTPAGEFALDPDPRVQDTIRLLFDKLDELGTVTAVLRYLARNGIALGVRPHFGPNRGQLEWHRPCRPTLQNLDHNPIYAGAYVPGRRPVDPRRKIPGRPATGRTTARWLQWAVLIKDHLPASITWDRDLANVERLAAN